MTKTYDIIIGGSGIIGSAMAIALATNGLTVALVDQTSVDNTKRPKFDGRAYALSPSTVKMLSVLDIWEKLSKTVQPILEMQVFEGTSGRGVSQFHINFDYNDMESGPIAYMVEDRFLKAVLMEGISSNKRISHFFGSKIVDQRVNKGHVEVRLSNKSLLLGKLLVGSDGRQSEIGERSGIKRNIFNYRQTSIVCAVSHEKNHSGEAHQFFRPAGPLAILPLQNKISSIVWTETNEKADQLRKLSDDDFLKELATSFGSFRGQISLKGERYFFPLLLSISRKLISQRVALIGDAAHAVHPLAGQGLNLGMRDVASLTEIIVQARRCGEDYGTIHVLKRYSTWRDLDRLTLYGFTHMVNKAFSNDSLVLKTLRGIGMTAINNVPFMRRALMNEASGYGNDIPSLMAGRKI